jgi:hypothetical protein
MTQFFSRVNNGTLTMLLLIIAEITANAAIWFCAGSLRTRIAGR